MTETSLIVRDGGGALRDILSHEGALEPLLAAFGEAEASPDANTLLARLKAVETSLASLITLYGEVGANPTANTVLERLKAVQTSVAAASIALGEVQASPTTNTVLDRLKAVQTSVAQAVTALGEVQASPTTNTVLDRLKTIHADLIATGSAAQQVQGAQASGATLSVNPMAMGGKVQTSAGALTIDTLTPLLLTTLGDLRINAVSLGTAADAANNTSIAYFREPGGTSRPLATTIMGFNGSSHDRIRADVGGIVTQPHAFASARWQAAGVSGGITNTTDVVLMAAGGASVRNYLTAIQYINTSATASEIVVKDGSTVVWRGVAPANMSAMQSVVFPGGLRGTANTAMNVAMSTTATATVVSAQGFQGA